MTSYIPALPCLPDALTYEGTVMSIFVSSFMIMIYLEQNYENLNKLTACMNCMYCIPNPFKSFTSDLCSLYETTHCSNISCNIRHDNIMA